MKLRLRPWMLMALGSIGLEVYALAQDRLVPAVAGTAFAMLTVALVADDFRLPHRL